MDPFDKAGRQVMRDRHQLPPVSANVGLDSLAVTQLMLSIEETTGVWVDESLLTPENLQSSETLAACVHDHVRRT